MKVYHGTSADNLPSILENGFDGMHGEQIWTCSSGYNYFWSPRDILKQSWVESINDARQEAKRMAKDSAEAALAKAKDCRRVVFEVDVPKDELSQDTSSKNMEGAVMASSPVPASCITAIWIDSEPLDILKGYFIACAMNHELRCSLDLSPVEQMIGEIFKKSNEAINNIYEQLSEMELIPLDK